MKNNIFILLLFALFIVSCDDDTPETKNEVIKPDSIFANLNDKVISSLVIDKTNTRWVGTNNGLFYSATDGYKLEDSLVSGEILSLSYLNEDNKIWIGTTDGLVEFSIGTTENSASSVATSSLSNNQVNSTCIDGSKIWFGTDNGITLNKAGVYKKEYFMTNELNDELSLTIENSKINSIAYWDGDYYFATNGYSVYRAYDYNESLDAFTGASVLTTPYNGDSFTETMFVVFVDSQGRQWMGGTNGLQSHTGHDSKSNNISYSTELPDLNIHAIAEAPDGKIWVGTEKGLAVFNETSWTTITTGLTNLYVTSIAFDTENGSAWIGTKMGLVNLE